MTSANDRTVRLREAGHFLRSRRERLTPADVGLPKGTRRRTPGLRREEVAMLADVGVTWYTWLEQGRDVRPSSEVLSSVAEALRLDSVERRHVFVLHDRPAPDCGLFSIEQVDESLRRMIDSLTGQPAYVRGRRWDVLAWNRAADAVYGPYDRLIGDARNTLHMVFADPDHRRLLADWEVVARASLAMFRADYARHAGDPDFDRLVSCLTRESLEFASLWSERTVAQIKPGPKNINHPAVGKMSFEYSTYGVGDVSGLKLVVFTPLASEDTAEKLRRLMRVGN